MSDQSLVELWNEDKLEPRYGVVQQATDGQLDRAGYWVRIEGCRPQVGDAICIIGTSEPNVG